MLADRLEKEKREYMNEQDAAWRDRQARLDALNQVHEDWFWDVAVETDKPIEM